MQGRQLSLGLIWPTDISRAHHVNLLSLTSPAAHASCRLLQHIMGDTHSRDGLTWVGMTSNMVATPANAAGAPSWKERRTRMIASSRGPAYRNGQNGIASSKRRTSFDTRLTICAQQCKV